MSGPTTHTSDEQFDFERSAYLSLADEFDPIGASNEAVLSDFDDLYIEAARAFAARLSIPLPWVVCSMDNAIEYVRRAEAREY